MGHEAAIEAWTKGRFSAELANARWQNTVMRMRIKDALAELGEPTPDYPAPVTNAVAILRRALHIDDCGDCARNPGLCAIHNPGYARTDEPQPPSVSP